MGSLCRFWCVKDHVWLNYYARGLQPPTHWKRHRSKPFTSREGNQCSSITATDSTKYNRMFTEIVCNVHIQDEQSRDWKRPGWKSTRKTVPVSNKANRSDWEPELCRGGWLPIGSHGIVNSDSTMPHSISLSILPKVHHPNRTMNCRAAPCRRSESEGKWLAVRFKIGLVTSLPTVHSLSKVTVGTHWSLTTLVWARRWTPYYVSTNVALHLMSPHRKL